MVGAQRWFEDFKVGDRFESPSKTLTDAHFLFFDEVYEWSGSVLLLHLALYERWGWSFVR